MKMVNGRGEAVYYNVVEKAGKLQFVVKGIGDTMVIGQAEAYLDRHGFKSASYR